MPPKQTAGAKRGRPANAAKAKGPASKRASSKATSVDPFASSDAESVNRDDDDDDIEVLGSEAETPRKRRTPAGKGKAKARTPSRREEVASDEEMDVGVTMSAAGKGSRARPQTIDDDEDGPEKTIPPGLVGRLLNEMFEKEGTRLTSDAARVTAKYVDVFVREAVARCMQEKTGTFLEVDDLEKVAPQLLMDF
ncbi:CENP-S associating centromere protein X-domain-containing protein [Plectosphaerella plurivora]|uniref:CENP-S associating centromere protein X-domain-containing protein n=1 Tax=Plectosphaerella plurivora TaxID=936078 RepID=A0A9P8VDL1_9PEZI|nr:CENP-S associating centromere protein X-domain-containing protein [Plectosphaerella plurivora]